MLEASKKLIDATNEVNDCFKNVLKEEMDIEDITPETLALLQSYSRFVKVSNEYIAKTAEMMTSIDNKMNELLTGMKGLN